MINRYGLASILTILSLTLGLPASAETRKLSITGTTFNGAGQPFVEVSTSQPLTTAEMEATTRQLASQYGYRAMTVRYTVPPAPEDADFRDWSWAGKVTLYPDGGVRVIGGK